MPTPKDRPDLGRIELDVDGEVAFAAYERDQGVIAFVHTFVPEGLRGQGLATQLIEAGLAIARREGLVVIPRCSAFADYMRRHPASRDLLAPGADLPD